MSKKLLSKRQVKEKVTYSFAHIDRLERAGKFPKRIQLGQRRVAWLEEEIDAHIDALLSQRPST